MVVNKRFLDEAREIESRWKAKGLLEGLDNRTITASLMECQRLFNETGTWDCCEECKEKDRQLKLDFEKKEQNG